MQQEGFIEALRDSSKEMPLIFSAGQELSLTLPGNLSLVVRSASGVGVKMYREKHPDRNSASIIVESDEIFLDIEQRKLQDLKYSPLLLKEEIPKWVHQSVSKEQVFCVLQEQTRSNYFFVLYWG
jgi:hypothetical protein